MLVPLCVSLIAMLHMSGSIDVNGIIAEVEQILADNPNLPKLSRKEIMDILNNITSQDDYSRKMRALMLVLPFNAKNLTESKIKELYTKAPITRVVSDVPYEQVTSSVPTSTIRPTITVTWSEEPNVVHTSNHHNVYHEPFMSTTPAELETTARLLHPPKQHKVEQHLTTVYPDITSAQDALQQHPVATSIPKQQKIEQQLTAFYPDKTSAHQNRQQPSPTEHKLPVVQEPHLTTVHPDKTSIHYKQHSYRPLRKRKKTTTPAPTIAIDLPSDMKHIVDNFNIHNYIQTPSPLFITPSVETVHTSDLSMRYNSTSKDIQGVLASVGLSPDKDKLVTTTTSTGLPDLSVAAESLTPEMKDLLVSFGLVLSENNIQPPSGPESFGEAYNSQASPVVDPSSYLNFKPLPLTANTNTGHEEDNYAISGDMKEFLASFGLVSAMPSQFRSHKSLESEKQPDQVLSQINVDMLNQDMQDVLANLGFITGINSMKNKRKTSYIFNPSAHLASLQPSDEESKRLTKLLDTVKKIVKENATLSQEEIVMLNSSVAFILPPLQDENTTSENLVPMKKVKVASLDQIKAVPDPLSKEELLINTNEQKNEVKRQQESTNETSTSTITTTTEAGPSLTDLADSFGAGETASSDTNIDDALPPRRPNGLYFLLDWNSFLDVGVENERRINLRFTPKLGNPRAFIPVTVP